MLSCFQTSFVLWKGQDDSFSGFSKCARKRDCAQATKLLVHENEELREFSKHCFLPLFLTVFVSFEQCLEG